MNMNDYQMRALQTAFYPERGSVQGLLYTALKLAGEAGEVADKVGKAMRDEALMILGEPLEERREGLIRELGDVLWYVAALADELECSLEEVAGRNLIKLIERQERGTLAGSGDDR